MVPIRIPTLTLTVGETVDFNHEIRMHGVANIISGLCGSLHNYLRSVAFLPYILPSQSYSYFQMFPFSYANAVFVYKCGQKSWDQTPDLVMRLCGFTIAGITLAFFFIGQVSYPYFYSFLMDNSCHAFRCQPGHTHMTRKNGLVLHECRASHILFLVCHVQ
jgi:hypothetical protein